MKKLFQILVVSVLISFDLGAANDKAFFWKAQSKNSTVYLLGSIHFANRSFYPLRNEIEQAFDNSGYLVVELDMDSKNVNEYQRLVNSIGSYPGNETIADHVSKDTYKKLEQYLKQSGIAIRSVEKQKPGMIVLTIAALEVMRMGLDPALGIDQYFLNKARGNKKILELETVREQFNVFLDFPDDELLLEESLYTTSESREMFNQMVTIWKQGSVSDLNKLIFEDALQEYPEFSVIYDRLFFSRNIKMAEKIVQYLESTGTYFVVVGAGHLIGERGITVILENKGYTVTRQ